MDNRQRKELKELLSGSVRFDCPLARYTSFHIGGPAAALTEVHHRRELPVLLKWLQGEGLSWRVIGRGTNLLVSDDGYDGVILLLGDEFKTVEYVSGEEVSAVRAGGGYGIARLSRECAEQGLTGLEFSIGIPGTVAGAVIMNAGAWGSEISAILQSVTLAGADGEKSFSRGELAFSYRHWSDFDMWKNNWVVTEAGFVLGHGERENILQHCRDLQEKRKATQPSGYGNAGSFFKNPPHDSAGRLIEACGLKGMKVGGAMVSEVHANFLVNRGKATAREVIELMRLIQEKVKINSGVVLEPEVQFL